MHQLKYSWGVNQALPKALGMHKNKNPTIIDATAGLGRDSFLLASLGAKIIMIERVEQIYEALKEAMEKARNHSEKIAKIINNMQLIYGDAKEILPTLNTEIILIDVMHPMRKSALVKQEMRILRQIVGNDDDAKELINIALKLAKQRLVIKWPKKAKLPNGIINPSHKIIGKTTRYDVFIK